MQYDRLAKGKRLVQLLHSPAHPEGNIQSLRITLSRVCELCNLAMAKRTTSHTFTYFMVVSWLTNLPSAPWSRINMVVADVRAVTADTLVIFQKFEYFTAICLEGEVGGLAA